MSLRVKIRMKVSTETLDQLRMQRQTQMKAIAALKVTLIMWATPTWLRLIWDWMLTRVNCLLNVIHVEKPLGLIQIWLFTRESTQVRGRSFAKYVGTILHVRIPCKSTWEEPTLVRDHTFVTSVGKDTLMVLIWQSIEDLIWTAKHRHCNDSMRNSHITRHVLWLFFFVLYTKGKLAGFSLSMTHCQKNSVVGNSILWFKDFWINSICS